MEELEEQGFSCLGPDHSAEEGIPAVSDINHDVKAVVVGLDRLVNNFFSLGFYPLLMMLFTRNRTISYYKMAYATMCIRNVAECKFVATNR